MAEPDDELQAYLADLPKKVRGRLVAAVDKAANKLADAVRAATPAGATLDLQDSVGVQDGANDLEKFVVAGGETTTKELRSGSGVPSDYALHVEFGTRKMPAQPFFYSTIRAERDAVFEELSQAVRGALGE